MKLTIEKLAPYLPYNLKLYWHPKSDPIWHNMEVSNVHNVITWSIKFPEEKQWKPILRPLSDLIKKIEVNGEKFVPMEVLFCISTDQNKIPFEYHLSFNTDTAYFEIEIVKQLFVFNKSHGFSYSETQIPLDVGNQLLLFKKLFEWHFDVFGLIDEGLAIDINTLDLT